MVVDRDDDFLTVPEVAARLGKHENTVRNWARKGVLRSAKIPGSRHLRFDPRDVDRLLQNLGSPVATIGEERRTVGPELIDATQLSQWAGTKEAQHKFPELVRRLLATTPGVTNITVRAGEGVSAPGWDGKADAHESAFLPGGTLCFELGVDARPRAKAEKDFQKRRKDPAGVSPAKSIFVFATPRRWAGAEKWASEKRAEGVFADVRVLDADDFEGWLQQAPAVHYWISEQLGRQPQGAETLEQWWDRFQGRTHPPLPKSLFLAGRTQESEQLMALLLEDRPQIVAVQASWRDDAIAFLAATTSKLIQDGKSPPPVIVVKSDEVWNRIVTQPGRMTLIPLFDGAEFAPARRAGHHVVIPAGWEQMVQGENVLLSRIDRSAASKALDEDAGLKNADEAYRLSALARRSLPALVRELARNPSVARPLWSQPPDGSALAPLVLIGSWTAGEEDTAIVSEITGKPWPEVERILLRWRNVDDPPFVRPSTQWHLASAREAFALLHGLLSAQDLQRWEELAVAILLEKDPKLDLDPDERPMASLRGAVRKHSSVLRGGMAQGIALLPTVGEASLGDGLTGKDHARRLVKRILHEANEDTTGRLWCSLTDELRLLAEASPEAFLDAVHADLDRDEPVLRSVFQDDESGSSLFMSSPHTGLLWALEVLCWSPDYLSEASRALGRLAVIDPGGRLSNRPVASLSEVFVGWVRHSGAPISVRVEALKQLKREVPDIAWRLLLAIWPSQHATSSPPSAPRFRDWRPETAQVSVGEWSEFVKEIVSLAIDLADGSAERWATLSERLGPLPPELREQVLKALDDFTTTANLQSEDRLTLWEHIDREVARHRRYPTAEWSMAEELLVPMQDIADRLEPKSDAARYAYLFDWRPDLPDVDKGEERYNEALAQLRRDAIKESVSTGSSSELRALAERSKAQGQLGWAVGEVESDALIGDLLAWLDSENEALRRVAAGWASRKLQEGGVAWLRETLARPDMQNLDRRKALTFAAPATGAVWDAIKEMDQELFDAYWKDAHVWNVEPSDVTQAVDELLRHGRPWQAIDLLVSALHGQKDDSPEKIEPQLIAKVLDGALEVDIGETPSQSPGYEVGVLLDYLEARDYSPEQLTRYEFAFFSLLDHYREPRMLYAALSESPDLFVDLVKRVYRGKTEERRQLSERDSELAHHAWRILQHWRQIPGSQEDGTIDVGKLDAWVQDARLAFRDSDREDIGDEQIGAVLSASPEGVDGIWPAEPVRELIERIGSTHIEDGFHLGVSNSRGITSRGVYDGGQQERVLASEYQNWARQCAGRWPRTSRVLRDIAERYEHEAREHDADAEVSGDIE